MSLLAGPINSSDDGEPFPSEKDCYSMSLLDGALVPEKLPKHWVAYYANLFYSVCWIQCDSLSKAYHSTSELASPNENIHKPIGIFFNIKIDKKT